mmetsp:Transcript_22191/g.56886  ORF Transcript_22191/g.56886 Transcript_22191/m.56886 type:complete len:224 (+) Transcript_22191:162-833(+)
MRSISSAAAASFVSEATPAAASARFCSCFALSWPPASLSTLVAIFFHLGALPGPPAACACASTSPAPPSSSLPASLVFFPAKRAPATLRGRLLRPRPCLPVVAPACVVLYSFSWSASEKPRCASFTARPLLPSAPPRQKMLAHQADASLTRGALGSALAASAASGDTTSCALPESDWSESLPLLLCGPPSSPGGAADTPTAAAAHAAKGSSFSPRMAARSVEE